MWWLWIVGPVGAIVLFFLTSREDQRLAPVAEAWAKRAAAKKVTNAPSLLLDAMTDAGQGKRIGLYEIVPKLAYLGVLAAGELSGSDQFTLALALDAPGPPFRARPLPIVDGVRIKNEGVIFAKDPTFADEILVEGEDSKAIQRWLSAPLREALLEMPEVWLVVNGKTMTATLYGPVDAAALERLVQTADVLFAEHGADGGPSLLLDDDEDAPAPEKGYRKPAGKPPSELKIVAKAAKAAISAAPAKAKAKAKKHKPGAGKKA